MKVLHVTKSDSAGGAARAAQRLHEGLVRMGHESDMLVSYQRSRDPRVIRFTPSASVGARVRRHLRAMRIERKLKRYSFDGTGLEIFSDASSRFDREWEKYFSGYDVVNLHWVSGYVDYGAFFKALPPSMPVVWTLHDMNVFTGGCHYDSGCGKFAENCGACPKLHSQDPRDLSHDILERKHRAMSALDPDRVRIAADSIWLAREAKRSSLLKRFQVSTIHYGLDTEEFAPRDRAQARAILGIPADAKVILFGAHSVNEKRKGYQYLVEALNQLKIDNLFLLSMGAGELKLKSPIPSLHVGMVTFDRFMSVLYSAADVFVIPSLEEAFGQTALESLACKTPVVGFDVGGIPDIVRPNVTGLLAPKADVNALRNGIEEILKNPTKQRQFGETGREIVLKEFTLENQACKYLALYGDLLRRKV